MIQAATSNEKGITIIPQLEHNTSKRVVDINLLLSAGDTRFNVGECTQHSQEVLMLGGLLVHELT